MSIWQKPTLGSLPTTRVPGLAGDWVMNEGGGSTIYDYSGNGNTGTLVAATHFVGGRDGLALSFDGIGDYVDVPDDSISSTGILSVEFWFKSSSISASQGLISIVDTGQATNSSEWLQIGLLSSTLVAGTTLTVPGTKKSSTLLEGTWYHVVVIKGEGKTISAVFIDGVDDTVTATSIWGADAVGIRLGSVDAGTNRYLDGQMGSVKIYNRALTVGEVQQLYNDSYYTFRHDPIELWAAATAGGAGGLVVPALDEGMLVGGLMELTGGLA